MALELNGTTGASLVQDGSITSAKIADGSVVAADLNSALSDTIGKVKAWVNFNGEGTVAIRAGYNVSSITDVATGNFRVNFTTALANTNAAVTAINGDTTPHTQRLSITSAGMVDTSSCYVSLYSSAAVNPSIVSVAVFN